MSWGSDSITYPAQLGLYSVSALVLLSARNGGGGALPRHLLISACQAASDVLSAGRGGKPYSASWASLAVSGRKPAGGTKVRTVAPCTLYWTVDPPPVSAAVESREKVV